MNHAISSGDINLVTATRNDERFVVVYRNDFKGRLDAIKAIGVMASDVRLEFTWYDAAMMTKQIRDKSPP